MAISENGLVTSITELEKLLAPIAADEVDWVAIDTETTEVLDERFTPYGTETRVAGFSVSYDHPCQKKIIPVDFYVPIRHSPYDWRRPPELLRKKQPEWYRILMEEEGVLPDGGWAPGWDPNLPMKAVYDRLQRALEAARARWIGHNWGFDGPMLSVDNVKIPWERIEETKFLSQLTDPRALDAWDDEKGRFVVSHRLKDLGEDWLGIPADKEARLKEAKEALGKGSASLQDYSMLPLRTVISPYACMDTRLTLNFFHHGRCRDAWKDERIQERYRQEVALIPHIQAMQERGVEIRVDLVQRLAKEAEVELADIRQEANDAAGRILNFGNSEALAQQLYSEMGVPTYRGKADTQKPTLKMVMKRTEDPRHDAVIKGILDFRAKEKELTAFFRPLVDYGVGGTIHTLIRQMAAATTRMSSAKPNLQQMKKKGEVRRVFKPRDGCIFVFDDYDQIEMRIAAHYTHAMPQAYRSLFTWPCTLAKRGDCKGRPPHGPKDNPNVCRRVIHTGRYAQWQYRPPKLYLYDGFMNVPGFDPHQRMADVAGVSRDEEAKPANFALLYGAGYYKLAEVLDCTLERAMELFDFFWNQAYPELAYVRSFIDERLRRTGQATKYSHRDYITTLKGGRIYLDSGYKGLNYIVQRSAREVFGDGLLAVCEYCRELPGYDVVMPVHDEVVLEVQKCDYDMEVLRKIASLMQVAGDGCSVPLTVGCDVSDRSWHKSDRDKVEL